MIIALIVVFGLALLIIGHEAGHFFGAKWLKMKVDEFGIGFPPRMFARRRGETEYSANWLPFGGFVRIAGENDRILDATGAFGNLPAEEKKKLFYFRPAWQRSIVILAGVVMNFVIGWLLISAIYMIGTPFMVIVSGVQADSPAAAAGIQDGDMIQGFTTAAQFSEFTRANRGKEIALSVIRDGSERSFTVALREETEQGALGVALAEAGVSREDPLTAFISGAKTTRYLTKATVVGFYDLLKNLLFRAAVPAGVMGPVGIFGIAQTAGGAGLVPLIQLLALISINLAVLNLVPFPALDGGRFIMIIIEKIKGSPIPRRAEAAVNGIGFAFLVLLMVIITVRDVARLF